MNYASKEDVMQCLAMMKEICDNQKQCDYCLFYIDNAGCRFKITPSRWNIKNIRNRLEVKENGMV